MTAAQGRIEAGRIEALIRQQPLSLFAQLINAGLFALILGNYWPSTGLYLWLAAVVGLALVRFALWFGYKRHSLEPAEAKSAARVWTVMSFCSGAVWGLPCAMFFPPDNLPVQAFMIFVLGGMAAGAVATLSSHMPAYYGFLAPALMPMTLRLVLESGTAYMMMGFMAVIFTLVLIGTARNINRTLTESLSLQIEKSDLVEELIEARTQAEAANAAKSAFLATVSHELRTPLNAVLGFSQLMQGQLFGPLGHPKYQEYTGLICDSSDHLLHLIDEIMDLSQAESGRIALKEEAVELHSFLDATLRGLQPVADGKSVTLEANFEAPLPGLRADAHRLRQIMLNVLNNAIKFTPAGGRVRLSVHCCPASPLVIRVRDTGIGMSEKDLSVAFEFFGRGENATQKVIEGAGIGLPLTHYLVTLHGGTIELASESNQGTEVTLRFPRERVIEAPQHGAGRRARIKRGAAERLAG